MADQIIVEDLQVYAYHGVYQQENEKGQNFLCECGSGYGYPGGRHGG